MKQIFKLSFGTFLLMGFNGISQTITQTVKGIVTDKTSEKPLVGAGVNLVGSKIGSITDAKGRFTLNNVPIGRHKISVSFSGYNAVVVPEVLVTSGKEVILDIPMEEKVTSLHEVTVQSTRTRKGAATNEYAVGSNRSFNVDEVTRFAGGRNDPSKLVSNYAGVVAGNDSRNDIVVRGNSPTGVLWRIEGLPAPSPNHYSTPGTTGGPVSALNTNALKTSDFLTGAFPSEFGNATAAVFDINLRSGNADKQETTAQLNFFSGAEIMLEGPLSKKKDGSSYLIGYRYSFAQIGQSVGINVGTTATPKYQDWVYNFNFAKGKLGKINLYGMGGFSNIEFDGNKIDTTDFYARKDQDSKDESDFSVFGAKHTLDIGNKSFLRTSVSYSTEINNYYAYQYPLPFVGYTNRYPITSSENRQNTFRFGSYFNSKTNSQLSWRIGFTGENIHFKTLLLDKAGEPAIAPFNRLRDYNSTSLLMQYYAQLKYKPTDKITFNAGLHASQFTFNNTNTIEPRASVSYQATNSDQVYFSFGLHSQVQPFPVYLYQDTTNGVLNKGNLNLGFTKAAHYVVGYEKRFATDWRFKLEAYYQYLYDAPVETKLSGFSILNSGASFGFPDKSGLVNKGTGSNKGIEITVEKFLSRGYYLLLTSSIFDSKYKGSDGVERNSAFNYKNVLNVLGGKEWKIGKDKKNTFTIDVKMTTIGGAYTTPIDLNASIAAQKQVLDENNYNSLRLKGYFRLDTKYGFRFNSAKHKRSQTLYLDLQNVTNQQNVFLQNYNAEKQKIGTVYQIGFFPDILYRLTF